MSRNPKKLPPSAKKVFSGVVFDVWQWEQELFDGSKATFEKLARPDTVQVIAVTTDGKILITNEEQPGKLPFISVPGGRVDDGEDTLTAAKRELLEETGYTAHTWQLFLTNKPVGKIDWVIFTYIAKGGVRVADASLDPGEKIAVKELNFEDFLNLADEDNFNEPHIKSNLLKARIEEVENAKLKKLLFS